MTSDDLEAENHVALKIRSELLSPSDMEDLIGLKADKSWKTGDFRGKSKIQEKMNGLLIGSRLGKSEDLENHILDLLSRITGHEAAIKKLSSANKVELSCAIYAGQVPALYFEKEVINKIAEIGASFDIDLYLVRSE